MSTGLAIILVAVLGVAVIILQIARSRPPAQAATVQAGLDQCRPEVVRLLHARQQVQAVRVVRGATGLRLQEAKDAVDAIAAQEQI